MYIINLEKLKIEKEYNVRRMDIDIHSDEDIKEKIHEAIANRDSSALLDLHFNFLEMPSDMTGDDFLHFVNIVLAYFFKEISTPDKREREHRLDVPANLKALHVSLSSLKKAINYKTLIDKFNLTIHCNDFIYILCDSKELEEEPTNA